MEQGVEQGPDADRRLEHVEQPLPDRAVGADGESGTLAEHVGDDPAHQRVGDRFAEALAAGAMGARLDERLQAFGETGGPVDELTVDDQLPARRVVDGQRPGRMAGLRCERRAVDDPDPACRRWLSPIGGDDLPDARHELRRVQCSTDGTSGRRRCGRRRGARPGGDGVSVGSLFDRWWHIIAGRAVDGRRRVVARTRTVDPGRRVDRDPATLGARVAVRGRTPPSTGRVGHGRRIRHGRHGRSIGASGDGTVGGRSAPGATCGGVSVGARPAAAAACA